MMRRLSATRRAEEFNAALEGRPASAELTGELSAFLGIVEQLRAVETPTMRAEFSTDLRTQLLLAAPEELANISTVPTSKRRTTLTRGERPRQRAIRVLAASCLVLATGAGVAAASQSALPGDPLYLVKRSVERIQVATAGSSADRGNVLLDQATTRLTEVQDLAITQSDDPSTPGLIAETLDTFRDQADDGGNSLVTSYKEDATEQSIVDVRTFASDSADRLDGLADIVPASARDDLVDAARAMTDLDARALQTCPLCSSLAPLQLSTAMIDLQSETKRLINPGNDPAQPGHTAGPGSPTPTGVLPTLPSVTEPAGPTSTLPGETALNTGGNAPTGSSDPLPTLPLPIPVPSLPLPSLPLPSLPLPSLPLPSLPLPLLPLL